MPTRGHLVCRNCVEYGHDECDPGTHARCVRCGHDICSSHSETSEVVSSVCMICQQGDREDLVWEYMELDSSSNDGYMMDEEEEEEEEDEEVVGVGEYIMQIDAWLQRPSPETVVVPKLPAAFICGGDMADLKTCSICLDAVKSQQSIVELKCNISHVFHEACIASWWRVRASCPLCRK